MTPDGQTRWLVVGDAAELGIVFRNLLENAVKYSDNPVQVRVGVESVGDNRVQVEIADKADVQTRRMARLRQEHGRELTRPDDSHVNGIGLPGEQQSM